MVFVKNGVEKNVLRLLIANGQSYDFFIDV